MNPTFYEMQFQQFNNAIVYNFSNILQTSLSEIIATNSSANNVVLIYTNIDYCQSNFDTFSSENFYGYDLVGGNYQITNQCITPFFSIKLN